MVNVSVKKDVNLTLITLEGRIDSSNAADVENQINKDGFTEEVVFDFEKLEYISSAGLRIFLKLLKSASLLNWFQIFRKTIT